MNCSGTEETIKLAAQMVSKANRVEFFLWKLILIGEASFNLFRAILPKENKAMNVT